MTKDKVKTGRKSAFREVGLYEEVYDEKITRQASPRSTRDDHRPQTESSAIARPTHKEKKHWFSKIAHGHKPESRPAANATPSKTFTMARIALIVALVTVAIPLTARTSDGDKIGLADAVPVEIRANSPTTVCKRWSHQGAILNGTMYIYGGQASTSQTQTTNTWNNNFLTLDLTKSWDVSSPALSGQPQPSGPPAVANGFLWNDYNNLYLYGGEFADNPYATPSEIATWQYSIKSGAWNEQSGLKTSAGNASDGGNILVQRAAEGAGLSVPELGQSWYFGGHLDLATTPGWSYLIARVYLKSLLEFTHPGYSNDGVTSLASAGAPAQGAYRNITQGGLQTSSAFSERADGSLVFVPGWGVSGVLIGLAGGSSDTFTADLSVLDVYDIASSQWYHQQTSGTAPTVRVNLCTVIASAPDASSFQIYVFGGQNLQPAGAQTQYSDMYVLSIPSFTWIGPIAQAGDNKPSGRAGHTCHMRDGQMIIVGGYTGAGTACDSPGIYVFNASSLTWMSSFKVLSPQPDLHPENSVLAGSYGYTVPDAVVKVIGGGASGTATVSTPASSATGGPFATGRSPVFTVTMSVGAAAVTSTTTNSDGSTSTVTYAAAAAASSGTGSSAGYDNPTHSANASLASPTDASSAGGGIGANGSSGGGSSTSLGGLITAVVIAVLAAIAAGYVGYCAWLYKRQVRAYKTHLAVANRYNNSPSNSRGSLFAGLLGRRGSRMSRGNSTRRPGGYDEKSGSGGIGRGWFGGGGSRATPPKGNSTYQDDVGGGQDDSFAWVGRTAAPADTQSPQQRQAGEGSVLSATNASSIGPSSKMDWDTSQGLTPESGLTSNSTGTGTGGAGLRPTPPGHFGAHVERQSPGVETFGRPSMDSAEDLMEGQEPSFFSIVLGPRRALRVVNGMSEVEQR